MAHPYRTAGRAGAKQKFKNMLGSTAGAKHMNDDSVDNQNTKVTSGVDDVKIMGCKPKARLDRYARGGKVGCKGGGGKTVVNIVVPPSGGEPPMPPPPLPPGPPGPMGAMPKLPPKPPMLPPPSGGAGLPAQSMMGKARGGYISGEAKSNQLKQWAQYSRKNSYHKKRGGGISGYPIDAGAESGVGRLQLSKHHKKGK